MPSWQGSFPVRISHRLVENSGKVCPSCGESDPLLICKNGFCANCASRNKEEKHHILGKGYRRTKDEENAVIPVSPNAHRLLSDLQANHPPAPADFASPDFLDSQLIELIISLCELWWVQAYLSKNYEVDPALFKIILIFILLVFLCNTENISEKLILKLKRESLIL